MTQHVEACPYDADVGRPDPSSVVEIFLRDPDNADGAVANFLKRQQSYANNRYRGNEVLTEHEVAKAYRETTLGALSHLTMLRAAQQEPAIVERSIKSESRLMYNRFSEVLAAIFKDNANAVSDDAQSGIYEKIWEHHGRATPWWFSTLPAAQEASLDPVPYEISNETPSPRAQLAGSIYGNIVTVESILYPICIASARRNSKAPPTRESLFATCYSVMPGLTALASVGRKVSLQLQYGRELQKKRRAELQAKGERETPETNWKQALQAYEVWRHANIFAGPAAEYDTALLDPDATSPHLHPILKNGRLPVAKSGFCAGQTSVVPTPDERIVFDGFFKRNGLSGTPAHGVVAAEILARTTLEVANRTLFTSEVWREGIFEAAKAVTAVRA